MSGEQAPGALVPLTPAVCCVVLGAGVAGLIPQLLAVGVAVTLGTAVHTWLLVRLALAIHHQRSSFGPCRGAGFLGMGVLAAGGSVAVAVAVTYGGTATAGARILAAGLLAATLLYVLGMLLLPGTAPDPVARIRRVLDGLGVGVCVLFTVWVTAIAPRHGTGALPVGIALLVCAGLATAVITGVRAIRYRRAALACCGGSVLSTLGLAGMALSFLGGGRPAGLPVAAGAMVFGPALCWAGARRAGSGPEDLDAETSPGYAGYPILALPVGAALLAAGYELLRGHTFDRTSVLLAFGVVGALAVRETFAMADIRRYARQVAVQGAHFRSLVAGSSDVAMMLDADLVVRWQSPAAARQLGLSDQDVVGHSFLTLLHPDDVEPVRERLTGDMSGLLQARLRDGFGHWRDTESTVNDQRSVPEVGALVVHVRDVGERRELERSLHRLASTDQLTGLANRRHLVGTLTAMRAEPRPTGAVLVIDLDGFTAVNDLRGHEVGDAVLVEAARRLRDGVDATDLPARLSDDEFGVATKGSPVQTYALASRLSTMLSQPYELPAATVHLTASVGIAELADAASTSEALSRAALALRRARQGHRGRIEWHDEALEAALVHRMTLEHDLPGAVARGELDLVYQPVLDLVEGHPVGAEALLRWRHPVLGSLAAADFVPVAEEVGLITEIGEWVLHRACRQLSSWRRDGRDLWLAVHIAGDQLATPDLVTAVGTALDTHRVPAERLVVEITEEALARDEQGHLSALRTLGVRTALTRFGTGSTPLANLRKLPIDLLKVDRAAVTEPAGRGGTPAPIIEAVVEVGRHLGMLVIAAGLEAEAHLDVVRAAGCRYGQGYYFGRPVPPEHLEAFLETHR
jgi:diguanylate cyclase (GGDEF)-like protein/PAS domain S-box-containing protein